eukprot:gene13011-15304_t
MSVLIPSGVRRVVSSSLVSWGYRFIFEKFLIRVRIGHITVEINDDYYPTYCTNGRPLSYGDASSKDHTTLVVTNLYRFLTKALFGGDIGFAESFILGDFTSQNLTMLLKIMIDNRYELDGLDSKWAFLKHGVDRLFHLLNNNTISGAQENIKAHYDLSNDMFGLFLDPTMSYSCAIFRSADEDLESAQMTKIRTLIDKANLTSEHHLLEIGSGWGALAMEAVRRTGCRVTTISLSIEQVNLARERILAAGLQDNISVELIDYRKLTGTYDRIISCEMLEAVGHDHYSEYFSSLERLLKPNGIVVIQFISFNDQRYDEYRKGCDFIQKYIFPGGLCPAITPVLNSVTANSKLLLEHMENFGPHYAITLDHWKQSFLGNRDKILAAGFDQQFINTFLYYFCYCEAAFATRTINLLQMVFSRPCNPNLPSVPLTYHDASTTLPTASTSRSSSPNRSSCPDRTSSPLPIGEMAADRAILTNLKKDFSNKKIGCLTNISARTGAVCRKFFLPGSARGARHTHSPTTKYLRNLLRQTYESLYARGDDMGYKHHIPYCTNWYYDKHFNTWMKEREELILLQSPKELKRLKDTFHSEHRDQHTREEFRKLDNLVESIAEKLEKTLDETLVVEEYLSSPPPSPADDDDDMLNDEDYEEHIKSARNEMKYEWAISSNGGKSGERLVNVTASVGGGMARVIGLTQPHRIGPTTVAGIVGLAIKTPSNLCINLQSHTTDGVPSIRNMTLTRNKSNDGIKVAASTTENAEDNIEQCVQKLNKENAEKNHVYINSDKVEMAPQVTDHEIPHWIDDDPEEDLSEAEKEECKDVKDRLIENIASFYQDEVLVLHDFTQIQIGQSFFQDLIIVMYTTDYERLYFHFIGALGQKNDNGFVRGAWNYLMKHFMEFTPDLGVNKSNSSMDTSSDVNESNSSMDTTSDVNESNSNMDTTSDVKENNSSIDTTTSDVNENNSSMGKVHSSWGILYKEDDIDGIRVYASKPRTVGKRIKEKENADEENQSIIKDVDKGDQSVGSIFAKLMESKRTIIIFSGGGKHFKCIHNIAFFHMSP